mmetsp:Transcript_47576/g.88316  ORF Transcript_47576/g.88316 Transcript_47576/m.88316 type:complete len:292 (-) Transcript_47576:518-1393(-)|eukprot:CAMPEP_0197436856 /NCGR_PEP_ID=MMETSP1175-20131217/4220_1 /TAXON_ID=1003142 /ORGANISM="Triceratium dubium, Strain CCMP147" /LENGTH=291 /DNA_ID=CAMNT_0042966241 /DNA_START=88 /DNA_END=963 /DNA_ORIENTATION=+
MKVFYPFSLIFLSVTSAFAPVANRVIRPIASESNTRLFSSVSSALPEGITKSVTKPGSGGTLLLGDVATVKYSCYVPSGDGPSSPFAKSAKQKVVVGDGVMIKGWELALQTMELGERATVRVTDARQFGYGDAGVPPFVPPGAEIEMDMEILDVEAGIDLSTLATSDPLKPRTPGAIAAAYKSRQDQAAIEALDQKEGLEGLIEKAKNFYFFGFFEGETGERPPWFLRPSITFPLAFLIVGAAFYVSYISGAITERGAQVTDELDEIIISSTAIQHSAILAFSFVSSALQF